MQASTSSYMESIRTVMALMLIPHVEAPVLSVGWEVGAGNSLLYGNWIETGLPMTGTVKSLDASGMMEDNSCFCHARI